MIGDNSYLNTFVPYTLVPRQTVNCLHDKNMKKPHDHDKNKLIILDNKNKIIRKLTTEIDSILCRK